MRQAGQVRVILASLQLVGGMGGVAVAGSAAAQAEQRAQLRQALGQVQSAHLAFERQLTLSLRDGTPRSPIDSLAAAEWRVYQEAQPRPGYFVDRRVAMTLRDRARRIGMLRDAVYGAEVDAQVALRDQLRRALSELRGDLKPARDIGIDSADYETFLAGGDATAAGLPIPTLAQRAIDEVRARDQTLKSTTAARVAAAAALQAAKDDAGYEQARAQNDLERARATVVLDVATEAAAINDLSGKLPGAVTVDDFESLAGNFQVQAVRLENILYVRSAMYDLLSRAQRALGRAGAAGAITGGLGAQLAAAAAQLDAASNPAALLAAGDTIKSVTTLADAAYAEALAHPPPPPGATVLNVPYFAQIYSLDCEEAALQMALAYQGINQSQDAILAAVGVDQRAPQLDANGNLLHWGDPYAAFVGDPNGYREGAYYGSRSGYGTYYPTIASAATAFGGHVLRAGEGIPPSVIYQAAVDHHPSVVWVAFEWSPHGTSSYQAWDGRVVMYGAPWEHAVTVAGVAPGSVLINNPHGGQQWVSAAVFEASYAMFNNMAVILR